MVIICGLIQLYVMLLILRVVLSWFPISRNGALETVAGFLYMLTDPVLGPLRRLLPPVRMGAMALDLSPIVAFFGLSVLRGVLCG
jgi:YggT family protein